MTREEIMQMKDKEEMALQFPNGMHFAIQTCEDGYDYTFYDKKYKDLDGGVLEEKDDDIVEVAKTLIAEECEFALADCKLEDYDRLMELVEDAEDF